MKKNTKDIIIIGFALFAMFFGAGNLIFPPFLGHMVGDQYILGVIGFVCTGVGLPLLAIIATTKGDGTFETMASKIGPKFAIIFATILFIAIGPMLAIPRTAATTYELTINPLVPSLSPLISMIIYFGINLIFVLKRSTIIDTIGKYLTPALILILTFIIVKGVVSPIGHVVSTDATSVLSSSFIEGYQTMDALAGLLFASVITTTLRQKKYSDKEILPMTIKSSGVAIVGLAFIYGGLMYLGAQTSGFDIPDLSKTGLLLLISNSVLGNIASTLIGTAIGLACLTTSIGLLTAGSSFFEKISNGKLPYKINAIAISVISIVIGCLGVDNIVKISSPILSILYPVTITLIITTLADKYITNIRAIRLAVYTSLLFGILEIVPSINLNFIPLGSLGFAWILPTLIAMIIGYIAFPLRKQDVSSLV
ncbi:branched-chain amino acid transport system II carrier protein [Clostridium botulinum]|uniref:Branched-chain amino acid transport system carrier protein n=1 Tax=Clostridium botulinum (strain Eklund 17B / Type B) TaxID=935198 RepID=B2TQA2_CLOBB|nr:branched-chain amino acid transport system II carrier protein [Clostridium botulinum B str. Eklund 17B (NRP)]MBY6975541.1 branched-chain amino acid transport system II carrier protein [Clostridium botulinum]MBY7001090.1 branched-chain amino acid transport system II carrier protein [Clostridium botulinum]MCR1273857.1 branched-chain amino acid transport system II carrier protein [Clostridium botulinum]NFD69379.1 branched-chain amino acid transport system II carrier protein [Clostridium botulin